MKRNVKIVMDCYSVMRMLLFVISHYLCVKYDFYNPGNSEYQSFYFPLIVSIAFLSSSLLAFFICCFMRIQNFAFYLVLCLVFMDFLGCILILIGFDFNVYISLVYVAYGAFLATLVYNFFKKKCC